MKNILIICVCMLFFTVCAQAVKVYPNPWIPDSKTENDKHGNFYEGIKFSDLPDDRGTIYIYNSTGELVRKVTWEGSRGIDGDVFWDGRNDRHEYVASGVYIWVIKSGGSKTGKIVIIR
jgi:Flagellar hook capping protein